ncbi:hypothetical protein [Burkholderia stabilis]|uniref:hypothetical protein n=1 Tax=Burkholderia stabilis TaxID=95485 RepID=UPI001F0BB4CB|nr:hypothetical protein [Burkholderia stabilis]
MSNQSLRAPLERARYLATETLFVAKWAFYIFFAIPSVILCGALALYSNFSFQTIPREILEFGAQTASYPPAPIGSISIQVCKDKAPDHALPPSPICQSNAIEHRPIEALVRDLGERLWWAYTIAVSVPAVLVIVLGLFGRDRAALRRRLAS